MKSIHTTVKRKLEVRVSVNVDESSSRDAINVNAQSEIVNQLKEKFQSCTKHGMKIRILSAPIQKAGRTFSVLVAEDIQRHFFTMIKQVV